MRKVQFTKRISLKYQFWKTKSFNEVSAIFWNKLEFVISSLNTDDTTCFLYCKSTFSNSSTDVWKCYSINIYLVLTKKWRQITRVTIRGGKNNSAKRDRASLTQNMGQATRTLKWFRNEMLNDFESVQISLNEFNAPLITYK